VVLVVVLQHLLGDRIRRDAARRNRVEDLAGVDRVEVVEALDDFGGGGNGGAYITAGGAERAGGMEGAALGAVGRGGSRGCRSWNPRSYRLTVDCLGR
jgi:hypothetical protein